METRQVHTLARIIFVEPARSAKVGVSALPRAIPGKFVTKDPHGVSSASGRCPLGNTHVPLAFRDETIVEARRAPN
jgi:hypothetical protein